MRRTTGLALTALVALAGTACATRTERVTVVDSLRLKIFLRGKTSGGEPVSRGYDHPKNISPVRMAHILSRIDLRTPANKGSKRVPAIGTDDLYPMATGIAQALSKANDGQVVVVMSEHSNKSLFIFDHFFLTSFLVYAKDDLVYIRLSRVEWEIPARRRERLPEPQIGDDLMKFVVLPSDAMTLVDRKSIAVDWRNPIFKKPMRTRITPGGRVVRRTILMEDFPEEEGVDVSPAEAALPDNLSGRTLRRLADLEDQRISGEISEAEYAARRRGIIRSDPATGR